MDQTNPLKNFTVLRPHEFIDEVEQLSSLAQTRVWMQAMYIAEGSIFKRIEQLLRSSAARGIDTRLHADWFCIKFINGKRVKQNSQAYLAKQFMLMELQKANIKFTLTNRPSFIERLFPYKGRNHMKITVIDSVAFLGGVNLADDDFEFADFMIRLTDPHLVEAIANLYISIENQTVKNEAVIVDQTTTLLIDKGSMGKSVILNHAVDLVSSSKVSAEYTCQFFPDGPLLNSLHRAYLNKRVVRAICPPRNSFSRMFILVFLFNRLSMRLRRKFVPVYILDRPLHAKLLIVDKATVVFGSHNLTRNGVLIGTGEVALQSSSPELVKNLQDYFDELMKLTRSIQS
jgi:phosphatidylserine/phosphatidylglycerophosphate/cardiolipin synthase-like enzyme